MKCNGFFVNRLTDSSAPAALQKQISASAEVCLSVPEATAPDSTNRIAAQKAYNTPGMSGPGPCTGPLRTNKKKDALCFVPSV